MRFNCSSKCSTVNLHSKNSIKKQQNVFGFLDSCIWIGNGKFSLLWREYSSPAVNMLTSNLEISDLSKNNFFKFNLVRNDENVRRKCFSADFSRFWDSLTRWLPGFQKQGLLCVSISTLSESVISEILELWVSIFF